VTLAVEHQRGEGAPEIGLTIETGERDGWTVVALRGELDVAEAEIATRALADAVESATRGVVADLTALGFLGSSGVRVLIDAGTHALSQGVGFRVVPGDGPARRIIEILGLGERLGVDDTAAG
jgi:anti-anti-sigma factor